VQVLSEYAPAQLIHEAELAAGVHLTHNTHPRQGCDWAGSEASNMILHYGPIFFFMVDVIFQVAGIAASCTPHE